jgi:uncharacterized membrane protein
MQETAPQSRIMAGLSYLSVLCFIPLLFGGVSNEYDRHHLRQGLTLFVVGVLASLTAWIWLPLWVLANLGILGLSVYGCAQALQGKKWTMPVLGRYALKIKL